MHPIAFDIGGFAVHWYGILVAFGFIAGLWTSARRARTLGVSSEAVYDLGTWILVGTIVGARLLYVVSYWDQDFAGKPWTHVFNIREGGLVFYGGLMGAALAVTIHAWRKKLALWPLADAMAPGVALGHAFGRVGCLMTGCCYGQQTKLPWAVHFPSDHWTHGLGVHPTQIYESVLNLLLSIALARLFKSRKFDGQVFGFYLIGYSILRSCVESFRGDYPVKPMGGLLTPGQVVSVIIFVAGLLVLGLLRKRKPQISAPVPAP